MDPKVDALKARIRPILEEFVRESHPDCELGAFVLNVFATNGSDEIQQETIGDGSNDKVSALQAYKFVMQAMQLRVSDWEAAAGIRIGKASSHIVAGAKCYSCQRAPATVLTRLVAADDDTPGNAMLWAGATCWDCAHELARLLNVSLLGRLQLEHMPEDHPPAACQRCGLINSPRTQGIKCFVEGDDLQSWETRNAVALSRLFREDRKQ